MYLNLKSELPSDDNVLNIQEIEDLADLNAGYVYNIINSNKKHDLQFKLR